MAKHPITKRDERRDMSRRSLIKWTLAAGAALGVAKADVFGILEKTGGKGIAHAATENPARRSVHLIAGNGGHAWFGLLWPHFDVARAANPNLSWHKPGMHMDVPGTRNLVIGPDTPFANLPAARQMTVFTCGRNQTHDLNPTSVSDLNGNNIYSVISALQAQTNSVVPIVTVGQVDIGTAPGGARPANVDSGAGIVGLFNSAASREGGLLASMADAELYKTQYDAFAQLNRASSRSTQKAAYTTASGAATFLGTNLASKLAITPADEQRYGIDGNMRANVASIGRTFIVAVKAFKMGLTNSIVLPAMTDDPHQAFTGGDVNTVPAQLKLVFDAFMADLTTTTDDLTMKSLADDTVITITGDTTKDPLTPRGGGGWEDGSPGNTNVVYVYSAGDLKPGWYGGVSRNGTVTGFNPDATDSADYRPAETARYALASIAYAIAKRDERAISMFANGQTISGTFGNPKDQ